jgi:bifunctional non-homologous end joining protein LigD
MARSPRSESPPKLPSPLVSQPFLRIPWLKDMPRLGPRYVEPMKARSAPELPTGKSWIYEWKLDGIRAVAVSDGARVNLFSRLPRRITGEFPQIVEALRRLPVREWVADGEIVAENPKGESSFQLLQNRRRLAPREFSIRYYLFDLIQVDGHDLKSLPLLRRKQLLECLLRGSTGPVFFLPSSPGPPARIWKEALRHEREGVIAKRADAPYEPGQRSGAWLKIRRQAEQECVIGGYTPPEGARRHFGAILVGLYAGDDLVFASKVGTGFNEADLRSLFRKFQPLRTSVCPFVNLRRRPGNTRPPSRALTPAAMRSCVWLKPRLVCQVRFLEWTRDGNLRQPVFLGLRDDKPPRQVVREPAPAAGRLPITSRSLAASRTR